MIDRPELFILGDSHTTAIARAFKTRGGLVADRQVFVSRYQAAKGETIIEGITHAEGVSMFQGAARSAVLVSTIGGNQFNAFGMIQHPEPFDFYEPDVPTEGLLPGACIIPQRTMEATFRKLLGVRDVELLKMYRKSGPGRVFVLAPPPPKEDDEFVRTKSESLFRDNGIEEAGVTPAIVRLKLWAVQVRMMREIFAPLKIDVIAPPAKALTAVGFLAPEFYGKDATHANKEYGEMVLNLLDMVLPRKPIA